MAGWLAVYLELDLWSGVLVAVGAGLRPRAGASHRAARPVPARGRHRRDAAGDGSLSYFIYRVALPNVSSPPRIESFAPINLPVLSELPFIGPALFQQTPLTFLALALFAAATVLYRTPIGLALRAVGEIRRPSSRPG